MSAQDPKVIEELYPSASALGANSIDEQILARFQEVTGHAAPYLLRRGVFNAHSGLDEILQMKQEGKPFYLYFPISPTERLTHLRHVILFQTAKSLQDSLGCCLVIHLTDTKAHLRDAKVKFDKVKQWTEETIKDILSFGFASDKTIIIPNTKAIELDYVYLCDLQRKSKLGVFTQEFYGDSDPAVNIGQLDVVFQSAAFASPRYLHKIFPQYENMRCLMLLRPSQKSLYTFACTLVGEQKPAAIFGGFVPALQSEAKMPKLAQIANTTGGNEAAGNTKKPQANIKDYMTIYYKNTTKEVENKIKKNAFSGGRDRREEQLELGARLEVDIPYFYYKLFQENDEELDKYTRSYGPGELKEGETRMLTGDFKQVVITKLNSVLQGLQNSRKKVTKEQIAEFTAFREMH